MELNVQLAKLEASVDNNEQYSRKNSLRISGLKESPNEILIQTVANMANGLSTDVTIEDINRVHRVGTNTTMPRAIIIKFATHSARRRFYRS